MMYLSRSRCSATAMLLSFSAFLLLLVTVRGHAIPGSALTLVEPPQHGNLPYSDSSSASELYQPQRDSRQMDLAEPPYSVSEIIRSKRWKLSQIVPPAASQGRSRINNRSMTPLVDEQGRELRDEELEVNRQLEEQDQYDRYDVVGDDYSDDGEEQTALQVRRSGTVVNAAEENDDSISGALARAARGTDIEEYFWKYVIDSDISASLEDDDNDDDTNPEARFKKKKKFHLKHKYKKFLLPLLLAYKLKFMMMFPALVGGLALLVKAAGLAGFFFALFASVVSLQKSH
ncbi:hypothetical protein pipiens_006461 [Culex pipiens pipiens]|uniref:Transmembrane protein n=1 Tax=Culex pipiens pipiens TaxID=38569 RepID=A0ABD1DPU5_CULPP